MARAYTRPLKVSKPEGGRIYAFIQPVGDRVIIEVTEVLDVVKKDNPSFAHNGQIRFSCKKLDYQNTIKILTQYLEDLFLKGMADESIYTGLGAKPKPRRTQKSDSSRETSSSSRKGDTTSVHTSPRGDESTESAGGGSSKPEVAESGN